MPRIRLGDNDLPLTEDLEKLTIQQWMAWIQARQSEYDGYTGQMLRGSCDGLAMIRDAIVRLQGTQTAARFAEASSQLLRDELRFFVGGDIMKRIDQERCVQRAFVLSFFFDFLANIPAEVMETSQTLSACWSECLRLLAQHGWAKHKKGWDTDAYLYLIISCMWFLRAHRQTLPRATLEFWLRHKEKEIAKAAGAIVA